MTSSRKDVVPTRNRSRRGWQLLRMFSVLLGLTVFGSPAHAHDLDRWTATWTASPQGQPTIKLPFNTGLPSSLSDQTIRHVVRVTAGGRRLRIVVSNAFGKAPLVLGAARAALTGDGASIIEGSDHAVTFAGKASIAIPPGAPAVSDPVEMDVSALTDLSVSLYLPQLTPVDTFHWTGLQTAYIASGDVSSAQSFEPSATTSSRLFLSAVLVEAPAVRTVVAFGDSITDGYASTVDQNSRWPDVLAKRLRGRNASVINAGISANQLLKDGVGTNALARFERDALGQAGVESAILLIGINDIGGFGPVPAPSPDDLIVGYRQLIAQARSRGVRIIGATLTPFEGALAGTPGEGYYSPEKEQVRDTVNHWIRSSGEFDAVIDFDVALRDPSRPTRLLPTYDSGDHLHPNDAGYRAMAAAVELNALFRGR